MKISSMGKRTQRTDEIQKSLINYHFASTHQPTKSEKDAHFDHPKVQHCLRGMELVYYKD